MKNSLQKKLLSYSALATALLAAGKTADAQIVYHGFNPDSVIVNSGYYCLDLNADGIYDFNFYYNVKHFETSSTYQYIHSSANLNIYALNRNSFNGQLYNSIGEAKSSSVNNKYSHLNSIFGLSSDTDVALKLKSGSNTYMGWIRLGFGRDSLILKDYAYTLNPSDSIKMGDIGCNYTPVTPVVSLQGTDTLASTPSTKYQWYLNGTLLTADTTQSFIPSENGVYSVITTDTGGCKTQSSAVNFTPCNSVSFQISSNTTTGCYDSLNAVMQFNDIPYGYNLQWYYDGFGTSIGGPPFSFSTMLYLFTDTTVDTFYVVGYNPFTKCYDTSNTIYYTLYDSPPIPIIIQQGDTLIDNLAGNYTYEWYEDGAPLSGTNSNYFIPINEGYYTLDITNGDGCSSTSNSCYFIPSGISVPTSDELVKVYTSSDVIYIDFLTPDFLNGIIDLYNIEGQKLQEKTITGTLESLNGQQLAKGMYFVTITKNEVRRIYKVVLI